MAGKTQSVFAASSTNSLIPISLCPSLWTIEFRVLFWWGSSLANSVWITLKIGLFIGIYLFSSDIDFKSLRVDKLNSASSFNPS